MAKTVNNYFVDTIDKIEFSKQLKNHRTSIFFCGMGLVLAIVNDILTDLKIADLEDEISDLKAQIKAPEKEEKKEE